MKRNKIKVTCYRVVLVLVLFSGCRNIQTTPPKVQDVKKEEGLTSTLQTTPPEIQGVKKEEGLTSTLQKVISPHWTGRDCEACHFERPEPGHSDLRLRFGSDYNAMCNTCHQNEEIPGDLHPVGSVSPQRDDLTLPGWLPLQDGKLTCVTCHDIKLQTEDNPLQRFLNPSFLRGGPYRNKIGLCFYCHKVKAYPGLNPHQQLNEQGDVIKETCLYCHQGLPPTDNPLPVEEASLRGDAATLCSGCHPKEGDNHPAFAHHITAPSSEMLRSIRNAEKRFEVSLPLSEERIYCGTCHNPHEKGVIKEGPDSTGFFERYRLRLDGSFELCISCHAGKEEVFTKKIKSGEITESESHLTEPTGNITIHTPDLKGECKTCHRITSRHPDRPPTYKLCFQAQCHTPPALIGEGIVHDPAYQGKCLICHIMHGSDWTGLLIEEQQKLCKTCHPLIKSEAGVGIKKEERDFHDRFLALFRSIVQEQEPTCSSCHSTEHRERLSETGLEPCFHCHIAIKQVLVESNTTPINLHDTFVRKQCTACHNPHSSAHPYLLKQNLENYQTVGNTLSGDK